MHPRVGRLVERCPFLLEHLDQENLDLPTVAFGSAARAIIDHELAPDEEDAVFGYFNHLAEHGDSNDLEILRTGAIELFNDSADAQRLARSKLKGRALVILGECRSGWGQPEYGA